VRLSLVALLVVVGCGPRPSSRPPPPAPPPAWAAPSPVQPAPVPAPAPVLAPSAPPAEPQPIAAAPAPIPKQRFAAAQSFIKKTKLDMYGYHDHRVGNVEGWFAPILLTSDGGFLVVGTRSSSPAGKFQVGASRPVVAKLDANGQRKWEHAYKAPGFLDYEGASAVEIDDGYVVYILSYVHPARGAVVRLVRIDRTGKVVWDLRLRGQGREDTPFAQTARLVGGQISLDGHIYKDASDTAYGWQGAVSLDGKLIRDEVGGANPYGKH